MRPVWKPIENANHATSRQHSRPSGSAATPSRSKPAVAEIRIVHPSFAERDAHHLVLLLDELNRLLGNLTDLTPRHPTRATLMQQAGSLWHLEAERGGPIDIERSMDAEKLRLALREPTDAKTTACTTPCPTGFWHDRATQCETVGVRPTTRTAQSTRPPENRLGCRPRRHAPSAREPLQLPPR